MVNVAGALDTLGRGLGMLGVRRADREEKEIEAMRREALAKLQMQHETDLAEKQQAHQTDLFERGQAADTERQGRELAFRAGERAAGDEAADRRLGRQLSATRDAELRRGREDIRQNYTRLITSTDSQMKELQAEYAKAMGAAGGQLDPNTERMFSTMAANLQKQREDYQRSMVYDLQRVDSGGYGAGLTEDQVRQMRDSGGTTGVGAKGPRNDDLFGPSVGGMSGAKSMTSQALGMQPMDSLQGQSQQPPASQAPQAPAPFPSMPTSQPFQADPAVAGAVGAPQDLFAPSSGPGMQPAGPQAPTPAPQTPLPGGAGPMQMDPTVSSVMNSAQPPVEIPPAQEPQMPPGSTPIQLQQARTAAMAARALQLVRARQPLDRDTKGAAKRMGWSALKQSGWTAEDLAAIGL